MGKQTIGRGKGIRQEHIAGIPAEDGRGLGQRISSRDLGKCLDFRNILKLELAEFSNWNRCEALAGGKKKS